MDGWFKTLVATTCIAVMAAIGWYGYGEIEKAKHAAEKAHIEARANVINQQRERANCERILTAWDAGDRAPADNEFGSFVDSGVNICRTIVAIDTIRR